MRCDMQGITVHDKMFSDNQTRMTTKDLGYLRFHNDGEARTRTHRTVNIGSCDRHCNRRVGLATASQAISLQVYQKITFLSLAVGFITHCVGFFGFAHRGSVTL